MLEPREPLKARRSRYDYVDFISGSGERFILMFADLLACHREPGRPLLANDGEGPVFFSCGKMSRTYYVYILASRSRNLYTGATIDLQRRMIEHRGRLVPGFTSQYRIFRLVHFETFSDIRLAIAREKKIKGWRREKRTWLIECDNSTWEDLGEKLLNGF